MCSELASLPMEIPSRRLQACKAYDKLKHVAYRLAGRVKQLEAASQVVHDDVL